MELTVTGMSCEGCEQNVEDALTELATVTSVEADHEADTVRIEGSVSQTDARAAIEEAGYEPA